MTPFRWLRTVPHDFLNSRFIRGCKHGFPHYQTFAVGLAGVLLLAGCHGGKGEVNRLAARDVPYIEDVPLPAGFSLQSRLSEDHESGGQRIARHDYRGFANIEDVRAFYLEQMPSKGWARVSNESVGGRIRIRFEKKFEACTIDIEPLMLNYTRIQVNVMPFKRTAVAEPPSRPIPMP